MLRMRTRALAFTLTCERSHRQRHARREGRWGPHPGEPRLVPASRSSDVAGHGRGGDEEIKIQASKLAPRCSCSSRRRGTPEAPPSDAPYTAYTGQRETAPPCYYYSTPYNCTIDQSDQSDLKLARPHQKPAAAGGAGEVRWSACSADCSSRRLAALMVPRISKASARSSRRPTARTSPPPARTRPSRRAAKLLRSGSHSSCLGTAGDPLAGSRVITSPRVSKISKIIEQLMLRTARERRRRIQAARGACMWADLHSRRRRSRVGGRRCGPNRRLFDGELEISLKLCCYAAALPLDCVPLRPANQQVPSLYPCLPTASSIESSAASPIRVTRTRDGSWALQSLLWISK